MKKRVIQINGFSGILITLFIIACLIAGFIGFPAFVCMHIWNAIAAKIMIKTISFLGGLLLWGIIVLSFMLLNKRNLIVSFGIPNNMSKEEISELFQRTEKEKPEDILNEFKNRNSEK